MVDLRSLSRSGLVLALLLLALALAAPFVFSSASGRHTLVLICIYAALAQSWNLLGGFAGQVSLGNAVFFGIGAYSSSLLLLRTGLSPLLGGLAGMLLAVLLAALIGYPVFRLGGHYFAIATIAIGEIALVVFTNLEVVGGATGLSLPLVRGPTGQPIDSWRYLQFNSSKLPYYYLALGLLLLVQLVALALDRSRPGYYLRAIKNDQTAAAALGVPVARYKLYAMMLSAACTALVGSLYAQYLLFIDPETVFSLALSVLIALVAILGGAGSLWGPLLGAVVLIPLSELTRSQLGGGGRALDLVIYGLLIMLISIFQPNGLAGLRQRLAAGLRQRQSGRRRQQVL